MHFSQTKGLLVVVCFVAATQLQAQNIAPFIVNSAGGSYQPANSYIQYEWSVGELAVISTYTAPNLINTNGVLQPCTENVAPPSYVSRFAEGELRLFPNPTSGRFELNVKVPISGKMDIELLNSTGQVISKKSFRNECCGRIEYFDVSGVPGGMYMLVVTLQPDDTNPGANGTIRKSTIKIVKISN